ncbi:uncharacterized protein LOC107981683 [Nasonia vitripennis]|uniref:Uncharacterized protein n=1 Tax=Nasonia vitripennis TaxID=7425 RepID=A0A7M7ITP9_NASVI|nr:uncharacterized protein LOC107981683 [Nasonia vitripennis]
MWTLKKLTSLAILCFTFNTIDAEERIAYQKHWTLPPGSRLFFNDDYYQESDGYYNLTYVVCEDYADELLPIFERNCTAVQHTQLEKKCPVTLKSDKAKRYLADMMVIFPVSSTKAAIVWVDNDYLKCIILDFPTCISKDVILGKSEHIVDFVHFVAYDDSFEMVINSNCGGNAYDKFHVDMKGNVISASVPWYVNPSRYSIAAFSLRAVVMDSKSKAYLHFAEDRITLIKPDGLVSLLTEFSDWIIISRKLVSTAHQTIGIAIKKFGDSVDVLQFDQEGKLKLKRSLPYVDDKLAFRNLANGGFLLFAYPSAKNMRSVFPHKYQWTKVDADGKVVGTIQTGFELNCDSKKVGLQLFENEAKEYCAQIACGSYHEVDMKLKSATVGILVKCVRDEDFVKNKTEVS